MPAQLKLNTHALRLQASSTLGCNIHTYIHTCTYMCVYIHRCTDLTSIWSSSASVRFCEECLQVPPCVSCCSPFRDSSVGAESLEVPDLL